MKDIRIDSHKLMYHPCEVARWLKGEHIYPIEIEISPSGSCNHRCTFCAVDYLGYQPVLMNSEIMLKNIKQMKKNGLKSVICSGEGEPLINKDTPYMVNQIRLMDVDVAMSTNGVLLSKEISEECLSSFTWIRFSIAAIQEELYQKIHRGKNGDLKKVLDNINNAINLKRRNELTTTLGVQCLLIPENQYQILEMAKELKNLGVDYFTIKPYSQHKQSDNHLEFDYKNLLDMEKELKEIESNNFKLYFRANAMKKMHTEKTYDNCYGLPFMVHIDSKGNVWPCINFIGKKEFCYGNLYEKTFDDIWNGKSRHRIMNLYQEMDINKVCREACRLDEINKYLYDLKNPGEHINFI